MNKSVRRALVGAVLSMALSGCKTPVPDDALVFVNGEAVTRAEVARELLLLGLTPADSGHSKNAGAIAAQAESQALEDLVDQVLVLQEASKLNVALSSLEIENQLALARAGTPLKEFSDALKVRGLSYDQWSERVRRRALCDEVVRRQIRALITVKPQDLRDYYWEHVTQFRRSKGVKLIQIFCGSRREAEKALNELRLGESPDQVAIRYSSAPEASSGGDLGWIQAKTLPQKLEKAAFALKKGKFSDIIATPYGWHILYAADTRPEQAFTLEQSAPEILEALIRQREQPLYQDWLANLRAKAEIKRVETPKGKS